MNSVLLLLLIAQIKHTLSFMFIHLTNSLNLRLNTGDQ